MGHAGGPFRIVLNVFSIMLEEEGGQVTHDVSVISMDIIFLLIHNYWVDRGNPLPTEDSVTFIWVIKTDAWKATIESRGLGASFIDDVLCTDSV